MDDLLDDSEVQTLIMSLALSRKETGFTESEVRTIVSWAQKVRAEDAILESVLSNEILIDVVDDEIFLKEIKQGQA